MRPLFLLFCVLSLLGLTACANTPEEAASTETTTAESASATTTTGEASGTQNVDVKSPESGVYNTGAPETEAGAKMISPLTQ